jgi:hypothetical protein
LRGMAHARTRTWDAATDAYQAAVERVVAKRASIPPATMPMHAIPQLAPVPQSPDGVVSVSLMEGAR